MTCDNEGGVVSILKGLTVIVLLRLPALSFTLIVQLL